jgi:hypothetical protein
MLDGNAVAGLLGEVFAVGMTTATVTCGSCGAGAPVGAAHVFRGAGDRSPPPELRQRPGEDRRRRGAQVVRPRRHASARNHHVAAAGDEM